MKHLTDMEIVSMYLTHSLTFGPDMNPCITFDSVSLDVLLREQLAVVGLLNTPA
jgi:hypothetical protein